MEMETEMETRTNENGEDGMIKILIIDNNNNNNSNNNKFQHCSLSPGIPGGGGIPAPGIPGGGGMLAPAKRKGKTSHNKNECHPIDTITHHQQQQRNVIKTKEITRDAKLRWGEGGGVGCGGSS